MLLAKWNRVMLGQTAVQSSEIEAHNIWHLSYYKNKPVEDKVKNRAQLNMWNMSWIFMSPGLALWWYLFFKCLFFPFPVKSSRTCFINTKKCHVNFRLEKNPTSPDSTDVFLIENMQSSSYLNWSQRKLCFPFPCLCIWCIPSFITSWIIDAFPVLIWQLRFLRWLWTSYGVLHPEVSLAPSLNRKDQCYSLHPQTEGVYISACIFQLY